MTDFATHTHHAPDYVELAVTDFAAAKAFYGSAFGWTFTDYGDGLAYVGFRGRGDAAHEAGGFRRTDHVTTGGPLVLLYSADLDASVRAVRAAGGMVVQEPFAFPGGRRFHFRDPSGNELGVWTAA
ncbi:hypothetical protein B0I33_110100 [Prauserella shujinwangii]|uniref:VOC domain-containing protein n=1 Tax=Prauserella shujinwangii TaxID=1453103 RepID=A0A2T0LP21_9PSEU|nr:VOC family protein [Prauserella shujinwangii]PRX45001.1 hypothetical protein B0I33_110100 [Prauserella shujinwangii]